MGTGSLRRAVRPLMGGLMAGLLAVLVTAGASGCSSSASGTGGASTPTVSTPHGSSRPSAAPASSTSGGGGGGASSPDPDQADELVIILEAVNPRVGTDRAALIKESVAICTRIRSGATAAQISASTKQSFGNATYKPSPQEAAAMDSAITKTFCT